MKYVGTKGVRPPLDQWLANENIRNTTEKYFKLFTNDDEQCVRFFFRVGIFWNKTNVSLHLFIRYEINNADLVKTYDPSRRFYDAFKKSAKTMRHYNNFKNATRARKQHCCCEQAFIINLQYLDTV